MFSCILWAGLTTFISLLLWPWLKQVLVRTARRPILGLGIGISLGAACGLAPALVFGVLASLPEKPIFDLAPLAGAMLRIAQIGGVGAIYGATTGFVWAGCFIALDLLIGPKPPA